MNTKKTVLLLAATLFAAPALVSAVDASGTEQTGPKWSHGERKGQGDCGHRMGETGHHRGEGRHGMGHHPMKMAPQKFEQRLTKRLEKMDSPELKKQYLVSQNARLEAMEQHMILSRMMAESRAGKMENAELRQATLDKIAADSRLKQQQLKLMKEVIGKRQ
ncbi:hypothetical protein [Zobellella maritima]|uniref:hypothetical protein n=1 Tax=Zobellella maritima TaxID=2059725 RepID=UPI000E307427|nr:hypothetical protein [Zobellella maritima]